MNDTTDTNDGKTFTLASDQTLARVAARATPSSLDAHERRMATDREYKSSTLALASTVPDAGGHLAEITEPYLRAKVADALDLSHDVKNAPALYRLAHVLSKHYPKASAIVRKQAEQIERAYGLPKDW
jgi:hypothetical protein